MNSFSPVSASFAQNVRASFDRQRLMEKIGASLSRIAPGEVEILLPFRDDLTQQDGFLHAGTITSVLDSACGYAAMTLQPSGTNVLTVEYKVNFLAPARGSLLARGEVIRSGHRLLVCIGQAMSQEDSHQGLLAFMMATITAMPERTESLTSR